MEYGVWSMEYGVWMRETSRSRDGVSLTIYSPPSPPAEKTNGSVNRQHSEVKAPAVEPKIEMLLPSAWSRQPTRRVGRTRYRAGRLAASALSHRSIRQRRSCDTRRKSTGIELQAASFAPPEFSGLRDREGSYILWFDIKLKRDDEGDCIQDEPVRSP